MTQPSDSDTRHLTPRPESTGAQQPMVDGAQEVTTDTKEVLHEPVTCYCSTNFCTRLPVSTSPV